MGTLFRRTLSRKAVSWATVPDPAGVFVAPDGPIEDTGTLSAMHTTEDLVEGRDELARILEGVKELPDDRRDALIMRFALGMDNREIARAMGRTDGATKVLIHRAIKQLEEIVVARGGAR